MFARVASTLPDIARPMRHSALPRRDHIETGIQSIVGSIGHTGQSSAYAVVKLTSVSTTVVYLVGRTPGRLVASALKLRPFDATLGDESGKEIVPATKLEFIGGYADLWKVTFDQKSIRGPLLDAGGLDLVFEARLNRNLDFKAKFPLALIK